MSTETPLLLAQIGHRDQHAGLGEHGMRLCFEARAQRDELRAVAQAKPPARSTLSGVPDWQTLAQAAATMPRLPNPAWKGRPELFDWHPLSDPPREADLEAALQLCAHCPALVLCRRWVNSLKPWERPVGVVAGTLLTPTRGSVPTGRRRGRPPKPRVST
jgi:hypothetical protein